jgi:hypothetical protein
MRAVEIGSVILMGAIALACSTKKGGGDSGGAGSGGESARGGATGSGGAGSGGESARGGATGSGGTTAMGGATGSGGTGGGGSPGRDAPSSQDGSSTCAAQKWTQTNWSAGNDYFRLYAGPDRIFARTWDATNGGRTFLTRDDGTTWTQIGSAEADMDILSVVMSSNNVFAGTWNDLCRSDSGGTSFSILTPTGIPADSPIWSLASIDTALFAGTVEDVYRSSDNGASWTEVKTGIPANAIVTAIVASGNGILAGTDSSGVLAMASAGTSWQTGDSVLANAYINQIAVLGTRVFAVTPDGLFVSDNNGSTWAADTSGLQNVNCLLVVDGQLWAGTDSSGVYLSPDSGGTWTSFSAGLPDGARVWSLAATSDSVFAGTSSGVWHVSCGR